jgi:hypothetical protein
MPSSASSHGVSSSMLFLTEAIDIVYISSAVGDAGARAQNNACDSPRLSRDQEVQFDFSQPRAPHNFPLSASRRNVLALSAAKPCSLPVQARAQTCL